MKRAWILAMAVLLAGGVKAQERQEGLDWSIGLLGRAKPFGAIFVGSVGQGFLLWDEGGQWQYGYIRPSVEVESIAVNSRLGAKLDIFPVSIFGISLKNEWGMRLTDPSFIDCRSIACGGNVWRSSIEARFGIEVSRVFTLLSAKWMEVDPVVKDQPFFDDRAMLTGIPGGDAFVSMTAITGYRINDAWSAGVLDEWKRMSGTRHHANMGVVFGRLEKSDWSYVAGAGYYSSEDSPPGVTGVIAITWTGRKGIGLF